MDDTRRRQNEAFERVKQFSLDNAADFPNGTLQHANMAKIIAELGLLAGFAADQQSGVGSAGQAFKIKSTAREALRDLMIRLSRTARQMEHAFAGIRTQFKMPYNTTDQQLLATARAWFNSSQNYESDFIAYGLSVDFRDRLNAAAEAFETAMPPVTRAIDARIAATAEIRESIRRANAALRILDTVTRNLYAEDPGKLAAWLSASHIERPPKKKAEPTPLADIDERGTD